MNRRTLKVALSALASGSPQAIFAALKHEISVAAKKIGLSTIKHEGDKWCVYSESGKKMGEYATKAEAEKRLRQMEYYKNH